MDKFKKKGLTKKRTFAKNTWYNWHNWLINYIPEPTNKNVQGSAKKSKKPKIQKQSADRALKAVRNIFRLKKKIQGQIT